MQINIKIKETASNDFVFALDSVQNLRFGVSRNVPLGEVNGQAVNLNSDLKLESAVFLGELLTGKEINSTRCPLVELRKSADQNHYPQAIEALLSCPIEKGILLSCFSYI